MTASRSIFSPVVTHLSNGISVICDVVPSVESCAVGVWISAGTRDERRNEAGVAHFVEHTSFRATANRTTQRIAREFENVGAYANAYTTKEETCYYVRTLSRHLPQVFRTLADVVLNPMFKDRDVEKERTIISEEIKSYEDEPEELIFDIGEQQQFGKHVLGVPIVGSLESVSKISADDVRDFHRKHYHAGAITICVSGNVDPEAFTALVVELFGGIQRNSSRYKRTTPPSVEPSTMTIHRSTQQAHALWHVRTQGHQAPDRWALQILNVILGDGMTSRLNVRLRESKGLAYSVYSQLQLFGDCGVFAIYLGVEERKLNKAQDMVARELRSLSDVGVTKAELARAKEQLRASKIMSLESLTQRMTMLGKGMLEDGEPEDPYKVLSFIDAVRLEELNRVAASICDPDLWSTCIIMPTNADADAVHL